MMADKDLHYCLHEDDFEQLAQDVREIKKMLLGNGQPGIMGRLMLLESKFSGVSWFVGPVISAILVALAMKFLHIQ